ncbi:MAG: formate dehydrogenase-N subunit alpha [Methylotetracoccus sp.]|nr:formate dehydrogenase-N subunit alpha [Methylotetracoccus sp.]
MQVNRRQFFKLSAASLSGSTLAVLGFSPSEALAEVRTFKLARTTETRNTCPYCSVACGLIMYGMGDGAKNVKAEIIHIEGDPDHPVSRGSLCPKGSGLLDFVHSPSRLKYPEYRAPGSGEWKRVSWDWAMERIAKRLKEDRDHNFIAKNEQGQTVNRWTSVGFLAASAASNETGYITNKICRALGIVMLDSQARICHAPSVSALAASFGRGAMTNTWMDIKNADVIIAMGGNPAEAHPVGFKWPVEAKARNKAKLIVVDPRFNRTAAVADLYVPIRAGTDIAFLNGVIRYLLDKDAINHEYVEAYTNAPFIVRGDFRFEGGLYSGYDASNPEVRYDRRTWTYELDEQGYAKVDQSLQHPRCVFQLLKTHVDRYTPELVTEITGTPTDAFLEVCALIASTAVPDRTLTSLYALGWTHHSVGVQNIRAMAMIQLLLGNIGMSGGGVNALRGHSNIQGLSDLGLLTEMLPGYITLPRDHETDRAGYLEKRTLKPLRPGQWSYWSNLPKFHTSLMKAWYGGAATRGNDYCYDWLPKLDKPYDSMRMFDLMAQGKVNGFVCQGFNPLASYPDKGKVSAALSKLKFMVVMDPLATDTSEFWQNYGEHNDVNPATIETEVFRLPTTCFAEEDGSLVNSSRWLQWHWKGAEPPGEARNDIEIMSDLYLRLKELYRNEGGAFPEPILNLHWPYRTPEEPTPGELAREYSGYALADLADPETPGQVQVRSGQQLSGFAQLRDDGTTACGNWIFSGAWTEAGNQMARRDTADPTGMGIAPGWAWAWPANRRILYNRASCDPAGKPWNEKRKIIAWDGRRWSGLDVPDYKTDVPPGGEMSPFIMNPEGVGRLFCADRLADGPFPEHYEPFETPLGTNPLHPNVISNPAARVFPNDRAMLGDREEFPYVATTYRLTELFNTWTDHVRINASLQPEQFVEIGVELAAELGIRNGERVTVRSKRGHIKAVAMVTKRIRALKVGSQTVHQIGIPVHWGFMGLTRKGFFCNNLTPYLGDANTQTPEFKAFLVNVEKDLSELMPHTHKPGEGHEERARPEVKLEAGVERVSWLRRILKGRTEA